LKDRQHNGQKKKDNRTHNDLQNTTLVSPHGSIMSLRHPFVARGHDVLATNLCDQGCLYDLLFYFCICIFVRKFEDTKGVRRIRKLKDRQPNGQQKKDNRTHNDLQNTTKKTADRATRHISPSSVDNQQL
jgi:hypothetical protein